MENEKDLKLKRIALYLAIAVCSVFLLAAVFYTVPKIVYLTLPFIIGFILSLIMRPLVKLFHKILHFPNKLAAVVSLVLTVGLLGTGIYFLVTALINQCFSLYQQWPSIYKSILDSYSPLFNTASHYYDGLKPHTQEFLTSILQNAAKQVTTIIQPVTKFAGDVAKSLPGALIFTIVMSRCDFYHTSSKFYFDIFIGNDWNFTPN